MNSHCTELNIRSLALRCGVWAQVLVRKHAQQPQSYQVRHCFTRGRCMYALCAQLHANMMRRPAEQEQRVLRAADVLRLERD